MAKAPKKNNCESQLRDEELQRFWLCVLLYMNLCKNIYNALYIKTYIIYHISYTIYNMSYIISYIMYVIKGQKTQLFSESVLKNASCVQLCLPFFKKSVPCVPVPLFLHWAPNR